MHQWELGALIPYVPVSIRKHLNTFLNLDHNEFFESY